MPASFPGRSFVWTLTFSALALWNVRLVSALPSEVIVDDQDVTRIVYGPDSKWFHDPLIGWESHFYNGSRSYTWDYGASAIFRFTGIGISITGPTAPDQALRMVLLNNVPIGTYAHETSDREPSTSFFFCNLTFGDHVVEVRHMDTRPSRILAIDTFRVIDDNALYPTSNGPSQLNTKITTTTASSQSSDYSSTLSPGPPARLVALIVVLPILFLCLVCSIFLCLWMRRRGRSSRRAFPDTTEKTIGSGQRDSWRNASSNSSEYGVEAQTIRDQSSSPSSANTPPRRRQLGVALSTVPSESALYPPIATSPTTPGGASPSQPFVSSTEQRRSRSPTRFFARLSHNFAAAFRGPSTQESAVANDGTDSISIADSYSTPMALGMRLNHQPAATAESTLHGSDTESGSMKEDKLRSSVVSDWDGIEGSTRAPSFSSRASVGHLQGYERPRRGDPLPPYALDIPSGSLAPTNAQNGQLSSSGSTGMVTALTHQTIDLTQ